MTIQILYNNRACSNAEMYLKRNAKSTLVEMYPLNLFPFVRKNTGNIPILTVFLLTCIYASYVLHTLLTYFDIFAFDVVV